MTRIKQLIVQNAENRETAHALLIVAFLLMAAALLKR
ncbi:hypothetical protein SAMN05428949_2240 [Chitinophaga sp. YR627]|jgi:hypothetical protein|uniref:Uncharacterized protein n=1 Tax=Chitinophaga pinensis (strain ATCC 43595 / DSM 2588 / LMG 13176 / NBRC 15968 / NCIMB 11800 / UQM 2034) TaxID=485918 RepID=A0A979G2U8_CHIPD|nr:hypothetical protein Cpin_2293 [Chitinophaga pinensis DSM 2588]SFN28258.1 hypothetical protein SAMN05428949_2240 [Chitinophaga sp. YR627]